MAEFIEGKPIRIDVSEDETKAAFSVPAPGANKFVINFGHPGVRIAFGEINKSLDTPVFHTAVTMHPLDAISLYKVLQDVLKEVEAGFRESGVLTTQDQDAE